MMILDIQKILASILIIDNNAIKSSFSDTKYCVTLHTSMNALSIVVVPSLTLKSSFRYRF